MELDERGDRMAKGDNGSRTKMMIRQALLMIIGICAMIVGLVMAHDRKQKDNYYDTTTGTVTGVSYYENSDGETMYSAVYTYYVDDTVYKLTDDDASNAPPSRGKTVDIRYDPDQPGDAYVDGRTWPGTLLIVGGLMFVMAGILGFIKELKGPQTAGRKLASELVTGFMMLVISWGLLIEFYDSAEGFGIWGITLLVIGIIGIVKMVWSVKNYIAVKMNRTPSGSIIDHLGLDASSLIFDDESEGEEYNIPKYPLTEPERAEEVRDKSQKQEYEKLDHLQGDGAQNPYSGRK